MKLKSKAFEKFTLYKKIVEKQTSFKIKTLRSDQGGEYTSNDFKDFYNKEGIK